MILKWITVDFSVQSSLSSSRWSQNIEILKKVYACMGNTLLYCQGVFSQICCMTMAFSNWPNLWLCVWCVHDSRHTHTHTNTHNKQGCDPVLYTLWLRKIERKRGREMLGIRSRAQSHTLTHTHTHTHTHKLSHLWTTTKALRAAPQKQKLILRKS